jgi:HEPN domain-containing protein
MNVPPERLELVRLWIEKAESDYKAFQNLLEMGEDSPFGVACYLCQQCVEKYLKSRLVFLAIDFPKSHDIGELAKLFPPGTGIPLTIPEREKLTGYAWKGRYPGDQEQITRRQAEEAAALAVKIRALIRAGLPKSVFKTASEGETGVQEPRAPYKARKVRRAKASARAGKKARRKRK